MQLKLLETSWTSLKRPFHCGHPLLPLLGNIIDIGAYVSLSITKLLVKLSLESWFRGARHLATLSPLTLYNRGWKSKMGKVFYAYSQPETGYA